MKYQCKVMIQENLETVSELFLQKMVNSQSKEPGSQASLNYNVGEQELIMLETIESNDMPSSIVTIYEINGVWNRCVNTFTEEHGVVTWTMDSEFQFKVEINVIQENFIKQTQSTMDYFKTLVESKKRDNQINL